MSDPLWAVSGAPFVAAGGLLVLAGAPKVRDPLPLVRATRSVGVTVPAWVVSAFAVAEVAIGLWAVLAPGRLVALLVAALYVGFTAFVVVALQRGGILESCGCFGKADTPPTPAHAVVTGGLALAALLVAVAPPALPWGALAPAVGLAATSSLVAFLAWQVMAVLPTTTPAAVRSAGAPQRS